MTIINQPRVSVNIVNASQAVNNSGHRVLMVGQRLSLNALSNTIYTIDNSNDFETLFGAKSMIAQMIRAFKRVNKATPLDVITYTDNGLGVAATKVAFISGPATADGIFTLKIGSSRNYTFETPITTGQRGYQIVGAMVTAINADTTLPYTAVRTQDGELSVTSLTRVLLVATARTATPHGLSTSDNVIISGANQGAYNALAPVTVPANLSITGITRTGTVATATTSAPHELITGDQVAVIGAVQTEYNGDQVVTVTGASTFTFPVANTAVTPATGTITMAYLTVFEYPVAGNPVTPATGTILATPETAYGRITLTANHEGTAENGTAIFASTSAPGTSITTSRTDGSIDPIGMDNIAVQIGTNRYQGIVWPWAANVSPIQDLLDARFNVAAKVLDGVAFIPFTGTLAEITAQVTNNSPSITYLVDDRIAVTAQRGASQLEFGYVVTAYLAAIRALRLDSSGQNIANLVISTYGPLDSFGGPALASKPYFNTPLSFMDVANPLNGFDDSEIEQITDDIGATVYGNNVSNSTVLLGEIVTSYKTDVAGNPDETFKYLEYVDTASQCREYFYNNLRARFAQSRLTEGDTLPGRDMANVQVIVGFIKQLYLTLSGPDYVLLESGEDALNFFLDNLIVTLNKQAGSAFVQMTVPIVTQLRTINATMKIAFSTTA